MGEAKKKDSAFAELGMAQTVKVVCEEIRRLYQWDQVPWVIGYSGGKDSSAVLQLVWLALKELPVERRSKPVNVHWLWIPQRQVAATVALGAGFVRSSTKTVPWKR